MDPRLEQSLINILITFVGIALSTFVVGYIQYKIYKKKEIKKA